MVTLAFQGARLFDGERLLDDHHLVVVEGRVRELRAGPPDPGLAVVALAGGILAPGFLDVQVNGGGGVMLNDTPDAQTMGAIARAHRRFGTTALLPTLITDAPPKSEAALEALAEGLAQPGVIGLHLEGPHLDPRRKGAHLAEWMRPLEPDDVARYAAVASGSGHLLVTLAANQASPAAVARLARSGVTVSIGHSQCTAEEADRLFDAGARGVTHLFNAMSGLSHREPGLVGAALARGDVWGGIIADGHHVDARALTIAFAAKAGPGRLFLVSDAMATVGSDVAQFTLGGRRVREDRSVGFCPRLTLDDGTLAGAAVDMAASVRFCVEVVGLPLEDALRRASADPAAFLGMAHERGTLRRGARADLVHLGAGLDVRDTWLAEELAGGLPPA